MARSIRQLVLDEDSYVQVTLRLPASLYRAMHSYCVFREIESDHVPAVASAAISAYFAANTPFQTWLRHQPEAPVPLPKHPVRPRRTTRKSPAAERPESQPADGTETR